VIVFVPTRDETTVFVGDASDQFKLTSESDEEIDSWHDEISKAIAEAVVSEGQIDTSTYDATEEANQMEKKRLLVDAFIQKEVEYVHHLKGLKEFMDSSLIIIEENDKKSPTKVEAQNMKKLFLDFF